MLKKIPVKEKQFFLNTGLKKQTEYINFIKSRSEKNLEQVKQESNNSPANQNNVDLNCTKTENSDNLSKLFGNEEYSFKKKLIINTKLLTYKDPLNFHEIQLKSPSKQSQQTQQVPPLGYYDVSKKGIQKSIPTFKLKYPSYSPRMTKSKEQNNQSQTFMSATQSSEKQQKKILFPKIKCKESQINEQKELLKNRFSPTPLKNFENFPVQQFEFQLNQYKQMAKDVGTNLAKWGKKQEL